ncbi:MAG TPA: hypothetical protein VHM29_11720, partial [Acidimicrobiia bacterium]|nr:hypothetical protein [Acidimicrobiia bacterium]
MVELRPSQMLDSGGPGIWEALAGDPTFHFDRNALALLRRDQTRWSHRWVRPPARVLSRVVVAGIVLFKRVLPFEFSSHRFLDRLGIWFMTRFVSEEGGELLLRHFVIETNVLAFIARNSGLEEPMLRPTGLDQLDDNAVIVHDLNLYQVLADLGGRPLPGPEMRSAPLDYSMLEVAAIQTSTTRRWLHLDLETGMCLMNIMFSLLTTSHEYRRAVHSLQLDESVLSILAELTGDEAFRSWKPAGYIPIVRTNRDVPRDLFAHAVIHEYIHARLREHARRCGDDGVCPVLQRVLTSI